MMFFHCHEIFDVEERLLFEVGAIAVAIAIVIAIITVVCTWRTYDEAAEYDAY